MIQTEPVISVKKQSGADAAFHKLERAIDDLGDAGRRLMDKIAPSLTPEMGSAGSGGEAAPKPITSPLEDRIERLANAVADISRGLDGAVQRCSL